jgi:hypothetical protein
VIAEVIAAALLGLLGGPLRAVPSGPFTDVPACAKLPADEAGADGGASNGGMPPSGGPPFPSNSEPSSPEDRWPPGIPRDSLGGMAMALAGAFPTPSEFPQSGPIGLEK